MENLMAKAFEFSVSVTEMVKYLKEDNKGFPLAERLLACGTGICLSLRIARDLPKAAQSNYEQATRQAIEFEFLMELMVETGAITELQSRPLLAECASIRDGIAGLPEVSKSLSASEKKRTAPNAEGTLK